MKKLNPIFIFILICFLNLTITAQTDINKDAIIEKLSEQLDCLGSVQLWVMLYVVF